MPGDVFLELAVWAFDRIWLGMRQKSVHKPCGNVFSGSYASY
jgi:hypothetical protein